MHIKHWFLVLIGILCLQFPALAQEKKPKEWNAGLSIGGGGVHHVLMPSFDFSWQNTMLRISPTLPVFSVGISHAFYELSKKENNSAMVFAEFSYNRLEDNYAIQLGRSYYEYEDRDRYSMISGVRMEFLKRAYLHFGVGIVYSYFRKTGDLDVTTQGKAQARFTAQLDFGINLFENYMQEKTK